MSQVCVIQPSGHLNLKLIPNVGQYHGTTSIDLILTSCWYQIAHTIWTSTHEVNTWRMCLENDPRQKTFGENKLWLKKGFGWNFVYVNVRHQFGANSLCQFDVDNWCQFDVDSWCQFDVDNWHHNNFHFQPMADGQLMSTINIILMSIKRVF